MHLLAAKPGGYVDEEGIVDLAQTPADIVVLSTQDTSLNLLARVISQLPPDFPSIRLANLLHLSKPAALDLYVDAVLQHSKVIIVSLLGGIAYWRYGVETLCALAKDKNIPVIFLPGDDHWDIDLLNASKSNASQCDQALWQRLWRYLREGGNQNGEQFLRCVQNAFFDQRVTYEPPQSLPTTLIYHPAHTPGDLGVWQRQWRSYAEIATTTRYNVALLFYRSHIQAGNTQAFDDLLQVMVDVGLNPLPIAVVSLKDNASIDIINQLCVDADISLILNTTGFAVSSHDDRSLNKNDAVFAQKVPVFQVILSSATQEDWWQNALGLRARDIAMNVALPEMDGRIITRTISFKYLVEHNQRTQTDIIEYRLHQERAKFVVQLAQAWCVLRHTHNSNKRVALILANYPTKEGRIGNGVGLDTPQSILNLLASMKNSGFSLGEIPQTTDELMAQLLRGITNDHLLLDTRACFQSISLENYQQCFSQLPAQCQQAVLERWGTPQTDPKLRNGRIMVAGIRLGEVFVGIQPARGYQLDVSATYHDPDLVPPHYYLAFYFWLRHEFAVQALAQVGKHGNQEWLPGKSVALSAQCWPEIALGPMPHIYPFIVNDPGEGAQAKRRAQAVIIDHLMPPLTRAETYGELQDLEQLVDEYYQAYGMDQQRTALLKTKIITLIDNNHLQPEIGASANDSIDVVLNRLDTYLCELKEAQIRGGLHILGQCPRGLALVDTLVALTRIPRGTADHERSLLHTLAQDLALGADYDPLTAAPANLWQGHKPAILTNICTQNWRTQGDTRERLELLAHQLLSSLLEDSQVNIEDIIPLSAYPRSVKVLTYIIDSIRPALRQSGELELANFLGALNGQFVEPGPSGAPTRGRLDVLPTGRNFYSVDTRTIPTPTAWQIGQQSADMLVQRHMQDHGDYPRTLGLSVWGTATMRTGGDDIAQAFALMGIKPIWEKGAYRVVDFEIIPAFILNRPRVDVTLRISGFFRDAFPNVVKLYDAAVKALATLEEPGESNTLRANILQDYDYYKAQGVDDATAYKQASWRIFGSKPGAYGAGLQGLIDERCWQTRADLASVYVNWGGYAYDQQDAGIQAHAVFIDRLSSLQVVVQNQDNREHDLLDSDDYYQFQGGLANAIDVYSGTKPSIYHGDHSNPAMPKIRTLKEELNYVIRSRLVNPKWITGMQNHGYKGAFEMAASVDYLFAYDVTTDLIDNYQYQLVADNLLFEPRNQEFLIRHNPQALSEMAERLLEAIQRGMWAASAQTTQQLEHLLLEAEGIMESNAP